MRSAFSKVLNIIFNQSEESHYVIPVLSNIDKRMYLFYDRVTNIELIYHFSTFDCFSCIIKM